MLTDYAELFNQVEAIYHYMQGMPWPDNRIGLAPSRPAHPGPVLPGEMFMCEWTAGKLERLPLQACSAQQLYRGFLIWWLDHQGGRTPPSQPSFTKQSLRWVHAYVGDPPVRYKMVKLSRHGTARRCTRCWLPCGDGPQPPMTEGEWISPLMEGFEDRLVAYDRTIKGQR